VALAMLVAAVPAAAQREAPIKVSLGAGLTVPGGDFNDVYEMGWGALGAVSYKPPAVPFGFRVDLSMAQVKDETPLDFSNQMFYGTGNLLYEFAIAETVLQPYLLGEQGLLLQPRVTTRSGSDRDHFGLNLGAGIEVKPRNIGFFAETRLHHVIDSGMTSSSERSWWSALRPLLSPVRIVPHRPRHPRGRFFCRVGWCRRLRELTAERAGRLGSVA
jgi:hypothetical protein